MGDLRPFKIIFTIFLILILTSILITSEIQETLIKLYEKGSICLIPELTLSNDLVQGEIILEMPTDLSFDAENNIYVCDFKANNVKVYNSFGKFVKIIGREGQGPGEFQNPLGLSIANKRLIVWDAGNMRLSVFTKDGKLIKSNIISLARGLPHKIRSLPNGDIVIESIKTYYFDNKKPQESIIEIYSPDLERKRVVHKKEFWENKFVVEPVRSIVPQPFSSRVYWDVSSDGKIIIGYSNKYSIEIHDVKKVKISKFNHVFKPIKITNKRKNEYFNEMNLVYSDGTRREAPPYIRKNIRFPKFKPAFHNIIVDNDKNILVFRYREDSSKDLKYFDAFNPKGKFIANIQILGEIFLSSSLSKLYINNGSFWTIEIEEDGEFKISKYRIKNENYKTLLI